MTTLQHPTFLDLGFPPSSSKTMLTSEDIQFIQLLIDDRIAAYYKKTRPVPTNDHYHTIGEIRALILKTLPAIKEWFGNDEFDIATFRHFLSRQTELRPGDYELFDNSPRWRRQVSNALDKDWPESPIISVRRRFHKLLDETN